MGWSITNILLDFTGGLLSLLQNLLDAVNLRDWSVVTGTASPLPHWLDQLHSIVRLQLTPGPRPPVNRPIPLYMTYPSLSRQYPQAVASAGDYRFRSGFHDAALRPLHG